MATAPLLGGRVDANQPGSETKFAEGRPERVEDWPGQVGIAIAVGSNERKPGGHMSKRSLTIFGIIFVAVLAYPSGAVLVDTPKARLADRALAKLLRHVGVHQAAAAGAGSSGTPSSTTK